LEDNNEKIKEFLKEKEGIEDEQNSIDWWKQYIK
jgi:hypothetical protein